MSEKYTQSATMPNVVNLRDEQIDLLLRQAFPRPGDPHSVDIQQLIQTELEPVKESLLHLTAAVNRLADAVAASRPQE